MDKKELVNILSEIFVPFGFKKKGNYWVINNDAITKVVNLQKSQFGNYFYINYGYIIDSIPLDGMMHIYKRVDSSDKDENLRLNKLLDLESDIYKDDRANELKKVLLEKIVQEFNRVNTEADILGELKKQPHLNNIPLAVKRHFNLSE